MRTTFQNSKPDGSPRVMLGYWRPHLLDLNDAFSVTSFIDTFVDNVIYAQGAFDRPVYLVDDEEDDFAETHCLILGHEHCPDPSSRYLGHEEINKRIVARHAGCPATARREESV